MDSKDKEKLENKRIKAEYKAEKKRIKSENKPKEETNIFFSETNKDPWYKNPGWIRAIAAVISIIIAVIGIILARS